MDYATAVQNMTGFMQSLPSSSVQFLFFLAHDLTRPKVCTSMSVVDVGGQTFYLTPGSTSNFWYAYSKGYIQYVVTPVAPLGSPSMSTTSGSQPRAFNATINSSGPTPLPPVSIPQLLVEHGKHLDFGLIRTRADGLVVKSHLTNYIELSDGSFSRTINECNFKMSSAVAMLGSGTAFSGCVCETAPVHTMVGNVYDSAHSNMLRLLCSKAAGLAFSGGRWKRVSKKPGNKAIRSGGSIVGPGTFLSAGFVDFLAHRLLQRIADLRPDLGAARVFYDEDDGVAEGSSSNIVVWYDFEDSASSMFQLDASTVFDAYHASSASSASAYPPRMTAEQKRRCLERFEALERALQIAVTAAAS